jgi:hypothetical protein
LRLEGIAPSVAYRRGKLASLLKEFGAAKRCRRNNRKQWQAIATSPPGGAAERCLWRISVAPTEAPGRGANRGGIDARWFYDWGGGSSGSMFRPRTMPASAGAVAQGHATLVSAPDPTRLAVPVFQPQEAALAALAARIKQAFDPAQIPAACTGACDGPGRHAFLSFLPGRGMRQIRRLPFSLAPRGEESDRCLNHANIFHRRATEDPHIAGPTASCACVLRLLHRHCPT